MADQPEGCARVTGAVLGEPSPDAHESPTNDETSEEESMTTRVGLKAPDFNAPAYYRGNFENVQLSDQAGNIGKAYGVYDETQGIELRGRTIDPDGVIQAKEVLTPPVGRRIAETVRQVQAYQVVRVSGGDEATPPPDGCRETRYSERARTSSGTFGRSGHLASRLSGDHDW